MASRPQFASKDDQKESTPTPKGHYTWNVPDSILQEMKVCPRGESFNSPSFYIAGIRWQLTIYPNGDEDYDDDDPNSESVGVYFQFLWIPENWDFIECYHEIACNESQQSSYNTLRRGDLLGDTIFGATIHRDRSLSELQSLESLTFSLTVHIHRITLKDGNVFYESNIPAPTKQRISWILEGKELQTVKSCHELKNVYSNVCSEAFFLKVYKRDSKYMFKLLLSSFPKGQNKMRLSCTATANVGTPRRVIEYFVIGLGRELNAYLPPGLFTLIQGYCVPGFEKSKTVNKVFSTSKRGDITSTEILTLSIDEVQKHYSLHLVVDIDIEDELRTLNYWNKLTEKESDSVLEILAELNKKLEVMNEKLSILTNAKENVQS